jgi:hypothetical protein
LFPTPFAMPLHRIFALFVLVAIAFDTQAAQAAGTVQLDLVGDMKGSALVFQEWAQLLGKAGIRNVRLRAVEESDNVGVRTEGDSKNPIYIVTGIVQSRDELLMPNGRIRRGDVDRLAEWIKDLAEHGPPSKREKKGAFGLPAGQSDRVHEDLATPVGFTTEGMAAQQVVERIAGRLKVPLKLDPLVIQAMADQKVAEELTDLSSGTALAYVLRSAGYGFLPRVTSGQPAYDLVKLQPDIEVWPIGRPESKRPQEALPGLVEFLNVNIQKAPAAKAIDAIAKRIKAPVLMDHAALARHNIDPATAIVSLPPSRTTHSLALRKLLFQAGMKFEVRYDEAGTPFLWITSLKPS